MITQPDQFPPDRRADPMRRAETRVFDAIQSSDRSRPRHLRVAEEPRVAPAGLCHLDPGRRPVRSPGQRAAGSHWRMASGTSKPQAAPRRSPRPCA